MADNINVITIDNEVFPEALKGIKDCPGRLYYKGNLNLLDSRCVAVVGSRTSTVYGRNMATEISGRIAGHGITVVSGMAKGIDSCAHKGALAAGGNTIAVLGCGLDICYPAENLKLMRDIEAKGLLLSEFPPGTRAERYNFPMRNRIISGLSEATVVVQARNRSGALITAELAVEQGRDVYALPGNIDSAYNLGNNKLISEGVTPLITTDDILGYLGVNFMSENEAAEKLSRNELEIYSLLKEHGEMTADEIGYYVRKQPSYVLPILSVMEMKGFIFSAIGKFYVAKA